MNRHNKFKIENELSFEKSALSMHCFLAHKSDLNMVILKLGVVKKSDQQHLIEKRALLFQNLELIFFG